MRPAMNNKKSITNILVCGVGGQGVMTATEILAQTAISLGYDAKKTEVAGMAQRGGVVTSHVRFGEKVLSPAIPAGEADILIGFEPAEAMRWSTHLRPNGVAAVNTYRLAPPIVAIGLFEYPDDPVGMMRQSGVNVAAFEAGAIARELGDVRMVNTIMLGAIADHLPFEPEVLREIIVKGFRERKPEVAEANEKAFDAGRKAAAESASGTATTVA